MAADLPLQSFLKQAASAIDLIVQLERLRDGRRCVTQVTEVAGYDPQDNAIRIKDIFRLDSHEPQARLQPTGSLPTFMGPLIESGLIELSAFFPEPSDHADQGAVATENTA